MHRLSVVFLVDCQPLCNALAARNQTNRTAGGYREACRSSREHGGTHAAVRIDLVEQREELVVLFLGRIVDAEWRKRAWHDPSFLVGRQRGVDVFFVHFASSVGFVGAI